MNSNAIHWVCLNETRVRVSVQLYYEWPLIDRFSTIPFYFMFSHVSTMCSTCTLIVVKVSLYNVIEQCIFFEISFCNPNVPFSLYVYSYYSWRWIRSTLTKPSQTKTNQTKPNRTEPSQAKPTQAELSQAYFMSFSIESGRMWTTANSLMQCSMKIRSQTTARFNKRSRRWP